MRIVAVKADQGLRVDGQLDEGVWRRAQFTRDFVQREPREGEPATRRTEFAIVYTDEALYVGARMEESGGDIRALVTRRDREETSDQLIVSLDTYRDYRTAYTFAVTAAGVRIDYYHLARLRRAARVQLRPGVGSGDAGGQCRAGRRRCGFRFHSCDSTQ